MQNKNMWISGSLFSFNYKSSQGPPRFWLHIHITLSLLENICVCVFAVSQIESQLNFAVHSTLYTLFWVDIWETFNNPLWYQVTALTYSFYILFPLRTYLLVHSLKRLSAP